MGISIRDIAKKVFGITDIFAGICFASVMALILLNIITRKLFNLPIMGTVELVGLLTVTGIGFSLARCELNNGNVSMSILTDKLPLKMQQIIEVIVSLISLLFWVLVAWKALIYAGSSFKSGWVSSTASLPIYPFIFILFFNVLCLCFVITLKLMYSFKTALTYNKKEKAEK